MPTNPLDSYLDSLSEEELAVLADESDIIHGPDGREPRVRQRASRTRQRVEKFNLETVLDTCIQARALIKPEQDKIRQLLEKAKNEQEKAFREYQFDLIEWQLTRAADAAEERLIHIESINTKAKESAEKKRCADGLKGVLHWFHYYAWAFDPRADVPLSFMPLLPFDFQKRYLQWLYETIFFYRTGGLVEKSRDMGATLFTVDFFVCQWLFKAGFIGSMVTRKEELVDSKKKKDTLFEKARVQLGLLPKWMMPEEFDPRLDSSHMTLINPENQAELTGEAPTQTVGRQGRATALLADEFAHWPYEGIPQNISMSFTCKSVIKVSSVAGMQNEFAREAHDPNANIFVMDWREHEWKDQRWYNGLGPGYSGSPMSKALIAQEVDRDYTASQPGRIWPMYSEPYTVITYSELKAFFHKHGVRFPDDGIPEEERDGRVRMPLDWYIGRANDRGATPGHRNAWLWSARPREHQPLSDTVFLYREWIAPIPTTYEYIANYVNEVEKPDKEADERLVISINSHEAESERQTYATTYGIHMEPWDTDYESGISQIGDLLTVKHTDQVNPFRPVLKGRTQLIIVVRDGQGELKQKEDGSYYVLQATDFGGMVTLRRQIPAYHYPPEEAGKPVGAMRPEKKDDDAVDCCFIAGTLITTRRGDIPIETVTNQDQVLTRAGWQQCSGAFLTRQAEVSRVLFSNGRELVGTSDHPVWVEGRGFISIDSLRANDIVLPCKDSDRTTTGKARWWSSKAFDTTAIQIPKTALIESIFRRIMPGGNLDDLRFTSICGRTLTEKFRQGTTFITRTMIPLITNFPTLSAFPVATMLGITTWESIRQPSKPTWTEFVRCPLNGIAAQKVARGTVGTARRRGQIFSQLIKLVSIASDRIRLSRGVRADFARRSVRTIIVAGVHRWLNGYALNARRCFSRLMRRLNTAPLSVVNVAPVAAIMPVYNLSVHKQPEYFANGVLVHNCRAFALHWNALVGEQSEQEKRRERIIKANPQLAPDYLDKLTGWEHQSGMFALQRANARLDKEDDDEDASTGSRVTDRRNYLRKHALPL